mgnify:CR=1 FL=1
MSINKIEEDISHIRQVMDRTEKFGSVSGTAGIVAGTSAIVGAGIGCIWLGIDPLLNKYGFSFTDTWSILLLAGVMLTISVLTAVILSIRNAKRTGESAFTATSKRLLYTMTVPLSFGGIFTLSLFSLGLFWLSLAATLLFYGLAMFSAAAFSHSEFRTLGLLCACLGIIAGWFPQYSLICWAAGFGLLNIIFGFIINIKHR